MVAIFAVFLIFYFLGYLLLAIMLVPINADCTTAAYINQSYNISMYDWITGNQIASIIIFAIFSAFSRASRGNSEACVLISLLVMVLAYALFELVWIGIGIDMFDSYYKEPCKQRAEPFNHWMVAEFISGIILAILILGITTLCAVVVIREKRAKQRQERE